MLVNHRYPFYKTRLVLFPSCFRIKNGTPTTWKKIKTIQYFKLKMSTPPAQVVLKCHLELRWNDVVPLFPNVRRTEIFCRLSNRRHFSTRSQRQNRVQIFVWQTWVNKRVRNVDLGVENVYNNSNIDRKCLCFSYVKISVVFSSTECTK